MPFRELCEQLGADYSITEMMASAPQLYDSEKNQQRLHFTRDQTPNIVQVIGNNPKHMADAARHYSDSGAEIIDINLGCPAKKINRQGAGSALLSDLAAVKTILTAVTKACPVAVSLKTRLGPRHGRYTLDEVSNIAESLGIDLITVHGRTRACRFNGQAQYDLIAAIKQKYQLMVIANGDIINSKKAQAVLDYTHCDGIMIGRAAIGNPWLFNDIARHVKADNTPPKIPEYKQQILEHISMTHDFYGARKGVALARKHIQGYLKKLNKASDFQQLATIDQQQEQLDVLATILST